MVRVSVFIKHKKRTIHWNKSQVINKSGPEQIKNETKGPRTLIT